MVEKPPILYAGRHTNDLFAHWYGADNIPDGRTFFPPLNPELLSP